MINKNIQIFFFLNISLEVKVILLSLSLRQAADLLSALMVPFEIYSDVMIVVILNNF